MNESEGSPKEAKTAEEDMKGAFLLIGMGVGIFALCSVIQAMGGSSMFEQEYQVPGNILMDLLMQVSWWPGWIATLAFVGLGVLQLIGGKSSEGDKSEE
ncbi:MAG: hypothetical protein WAW88_04065 [Nocardioides sp.]